MNEASPMDVPKRGIDASKAETKALLPAQRKLFDRLARRGRAAAPQLRGVRAAVAAALVLTWFLGASPAGDYLALKLYIEPLLKTRARLGLQPSLDPRARLVLQDDFTLQKRGAPLTFGQWAAIGETFFALGYDQVFLLGFPSLSGEIGSVPPRSGRGTFVIGAAVASDAGNRRAVAASDLLSHLLTTATGAPALPEAHVLLAPAKVAQRFADRVGLMNAATDLTAPAGFAVGENAQVLPHIALHALADLGWAAAGPTSRGAVVPISDDGTIFVDLPAPASLIAASSRAALFLGEDGRPVAALPAAARARLEGGRVAILIPEAFSGARFLDSPFGKVPSYMGTVALLNSALQGAFLRQPGSAARTTAALAPLLFLLAFIRRSRRLAAALAAAAVVALAAAVAGALAAGWLLPLVQAEMMIAAVGFVRLSHDAMAAAIGRARLSRDLEMGRLVQRLCLPPNAEGEAAGYAYRVVFRPYGLMSGDWFQTFAGVDAAGERVAVLAIGDAVGKGPSAALLTAVIASIWRRLERRWRSGEPVSAEVVVREIEAGVIDTFAGEQNSTLALVVLSATGVKTLAIAAPSWFHVKPATQEVARLARRPANPLGLGAARTAVHGVLDVALAPGDTLITFTDGVIDGSVGERLFQEALGARLRAVADGPGAGLDFATFEAAARLIGARSALPDDFTMLLVRRLAPAAAAAAKESA